MFGYIYAVMHAYMHITYVYNIFSWFVIFSVSLSPSVLKSNVTYLPNTLN